MVNKVASTASIKWKIRDSHWTRQWKWCCTQTMAVLEQARLLFYIFSIPLVLAGEEILCFFCHYILTDWELIKKKIPPLLTLELWCVVKLTARQPAPPQDMMDQFLWTETSRGRCRPMLFIGRWDAGPAAGVPNYISHVEYPFRFNLLPFVDPYLKTSTWGEDR